MVVDGLESDAIGRSAANEPFGPAVVDLAVCMAVSDCLLNVGAIQTALATTELGVLRPDESLDPHRRSLLGHVSCILPAAPVSPA